MNHTLEQLRGAVRLLLDPARLVDKFLDWIEELSEHIALEIAHADGSASGETRRLGVAP